MIPTKAFAWNPGLPLRWEGKLAAWWLVEKGPGEWPIAEMATDLHVTTVEAGRAVDLLRFSRFATQHGNNVILTEEVWKEVTNGADAHGDSSPEWTSSDTGKGPAKLVEVGGKQKATPKKSKLAAALDTVKRG